MNKYVIFSSLMSLTLSWRRPLSYRNQSIDLLRKLMDWFLLDNGLRHERVKGKLLFYKKGTEELIMFIFYVDF